MGAAELKRLDGWKAIADHLGRGTRTAQRWHRQRGMPVHYVPGSRGGGVFAYGAELDEWLANGTSHKTIEPPQRPTHADSVVPPVSGADTWRSHRFVPARSRIFTITAAALLFFGTAAAFGLLTIRSRDSGRIPTQWELTGRVLSALDANRTVVWRFELPIGQAAAQANLQPALLGTLPVDFNADGTIELVAVVNYIDNAGHIAADPQVYCMSRDGRLLWMYRPQRALSFGGREFAGPWRAHAPPVAASFGRAAWLSFIDRTWWPSFVVRLDVDGTERLAFVNAGHVDVLQRIATETGALMLAGGFNNEFMMPAMAAFDEEGAAVTSPPGAGPSFRCDNCPAAGPSKYLLFPRSEVNTALGKPFVSVSEIDTPDRRGFIDVSVRESYRGIRTIYRLSVDLEPESVAFSDAYWAVHRELSDAGRIGHRPEECPDRHAGTLVRVWESNTGWGEIRVRPAFSSHMSE